MMIVSKASGLAIGALLLAATAHAEPKPDATADGAWVSLTGKIVGKGNGAIELDYGGGLIDVGLAAFAKPGNGALRTGDWVTITGRLDEQLYRTRTLDADSLFVDRLDTFIHASANGESAGYYAGQISYFSKGDYSLDGREWLATAGEVVQVGIQQLTIDTGPRTMIVDMSDIEPGVSPARGDRISVSGTMGYSTLFDDPELTATSVTLLTRG